MAAYGNKTEHAFKLFSKDLKEKKFSNVILMHGEEEYLIDWAVSSLVSTFVDPSMKTLDYVKPDDSDMNMDRVIEACETFSMFSEKRIVWLKDFAPLNSANVKGFDQSEKERLLAYISDSNDGTILVISNKEINEKNEFAKSIKANAQVYNFDKLDSNTLEAFLMKRIKAQGKTIDVKTLRFLIDESGYFHKESEYRIYNFESDIKKIAAHCDGTVITEEDINYTINGDEDTFVFNFLDAVTAGKKELAFEMLHSILNSGSDEYSIIALLVNQFELMYQIKEFREEGMSPVITAKHMKMNEFRVKKAAGFAEKFSKDKLKNTLIKLYETDRNIKNGSLDGTLSLELIVAGL